MKCLKLIQKNNQTRIIIWNFLDPVGTSDTMYSSEHIFATSICEAPYKDEEKANIAKPKQVASKNVYRPSSPSFDDDDWV